MAGWLNTAREASSMDVVRQSGQGQFSVNVEGPHQSDSPQLVCKGLRLWSEGHTQYLTWGSTSQ